MQSKNNPNWDHSISPGRFTQYLVVQLYFIPQHIVRQSSTYPQQNS